MLLSQSKYVQEGTLILGDKFVVLSVYFIMVRTTTSNFKEKNKLIFYIFVPINFTAFKKRHHLSLFFIKGFNYQSEIFHRYPFLPRHSWLQNEMEHNKMALSTIKRC